MALTPMTPDPLSSFPSPGPVDPAALEGFNMSSAAPEPVGTGERDMADIVGNAIGSLRQSGQFKETNSDLYKIYDYKQAEPYLTGFGSSGFVGSQSAEYNAERQRYYHQLANGVVKGLGLAGTTFINGTVGFLDGIGAVVNSGINGPTDFSKFFDNDTTKATEQFNSAMERWFPNYYTEKEKNAPALSTDNLFTMNFLADKLIKNAGFAVGAYLSGYAYAGVGRLAGIGKMASAWTKAINGGEIEALALSSGDDLINQGTNIMKLVEKQQRSAKVITDSWVNQMGMTFSTMGEANMEAYEGLNSVRDRLISDQETILGRPLKDEEYKDIEDRAKQAANIRWLSNVALLNVTNRIQLPKILGAKNFAGERQILNREINDIAVKSGEKQVSGQLVAKAGESYAVKEAEKNIGKLAMLTDYAKRAGSLLVSPSEMFEEGAQYVIQTGTDRSANYAEQTTVADFLQNHNDSDKRSAFQDMISFGIPQLFSEKEGIESLILGGLTGGLMEGVMGGERAIEKRKTSNTQNMVKGMNENMVTPYMKERFDSGVNGMVSEEARAQAIARNDVHTALNERTNSFVNFALPRLFYGRKDLATEELMQYHSSRMTFDVAKKELGLPDSATTKELDEHINESVANIEKLDKMLTHVEAIYPNLYAKDGTINPLAKGLVFATYKIDDFEQRIAKIMTDMSGLGLTDIGMMTNVQLRKDAGLSLEDLRNKLNKDLKAALKGKTINGQPVDELTYMQKLNDIERLQNLRETYINDYNQIRKQEFLGNQALMNGKLDEQTKLDDYLSFERHMWNSQRVNNYTANTTSRLNAMKLSSALEKAIQANQNLNPAEVDKLATMLENDMSYFMPDDLAHINGLLNTIKNKGRVDFDNALKGDVSQNDVRDIQDAINGTSGMTLEQTMDMVISEADNNIAMGEGTRAGYDALISAYQNSKDYMDLYNRLDKAINNPGRNATPITKDRNAINRDIAKIFEDLGTTVINSFNLDKEGFDDIESVEAVISRIKNLRRIFNDRNEDFFKNNTAFGKKADYLKELDDMLAELETVKQETLKNVENLQKNDINYAKSNREFKAAILGWSINTDAPDNDAVYNKIASIIGKTELDDLLAKHKTAPDERYVYEIYQKLHNATKADPTLKASLQTIIDAEITKIKTDLDTFKVKNRDRSTIESKPSKDFWYDNIYNYYQDILTSIADNKASEIYRKSRNIQDVIKYLQDTPGITLNQTQFTQDELIEHFIKGEKLRALNSLEKLNNVTDSFDFTKYWQSVDLKLQALKANGIVPTMRQLQVVEDIVMDLFTDKDATQDFVGWTYFNGRIGSGKTRVVAATLLDVLKSVTSESDINKLVYAAGDKAVAGLNLEDALGLTQTLQVDPSGRMTGGRSIQTVIQDLNNDNTDLKQVRFILGDEFARPSFTELRELAKALAEFNKRNNLSVRLVGMGDTLQSSANVAINVNIKSIDKNLSLSTELATSYRSPLFSINVVQSIFDNARVTNVLNSNPKLVSQKETNPDGTIKTDGLWIGVTGVKAGTSFNDAENDMVAEVTVRSNATKMVAGSPTPVPVTQILIITNPANVGALTTKLIASGANMSNIDVLNIEQAQGLSAVDVYVHLDPAAAEYNNDMLKFNRDMYTALRAKQYMHITNLVAENIVDPALQMRYLSIMQKVQTTNMQIKEDVENVKKHLETVFKAAPLTSTPTPPPSTPSTTPSTPPTTPPPGTPPTGTPPPGTPPATPPPGTPPAPAPSPAPTPAPTGTPPTGTPPSTTPTPGEPESGTEETKGAEETPPTPPEATATSEESGAPVTDETFNVPVQLKKVADLDAVLSEEIAAKDKLQELETKLNELAKEIDKTVKEFYASSDEDKRSELRDKINDGITDYNEMYSQYHNDFGDLVNMMSRRGVEPTGTAEEFTYSPRRDDPIDTLGTENDFVVQNEKAEPGFVISIKPSFEKNDLLDTNEEVTVAYSRGTAYKTSNNIDFFPGSELLIIPVNKNGKLLYGVYYPIQASGKEYYHEMGAISKEQMDDFIARGIMTKPLVNYTATVVNDPSTDINADLYKIEKLNKADTAIGKATLRDLSSITYNYDYATDNPTQRDGTSMDSVLTAWKSSAGISNEEFEKRFERPRVMTMSVNDVKNYNKRYQEYYNTTSDNLTPLQAGRHYIVLTPKDSARIPQFIELEPRTLVLDSASLVQPQNSIINQWYITPLQQFVQAVEEYDAVLKDVFNNIGVDFNEIETIIQNTQYTVPGSTPPIRVFEDVMEFRHGNSLYNDLAYAFVNMNYNGKDWFKDRGNKFDSKGSETYKAAALVFYDKLFTNLQNSNRKRELMEASRKVYQSMKGDQLVLLKDYYDLQEGKRVKPDAATEISTNPQRYMPIIDVKNSRNALGGAQMAMHLIAYGNQNVEVTNDDNTNTRYSMGIMIKQPKSKKDKTLITKYAGRHLMDRRSQSNMNAQSGSIFDYIFLQAAIIGNPGQFDFQFDGYQDRIIIESYYNSKNPKGAMSFNEFLDFAEKNLNDSTMTARQALNNIPEWELFKEAVNYSLNNVKKVGHNAQSIKEDILNKRSADGTRHQFGMKDYDGIKRSVSLRMNIPIQLTQSRYTNWNTPMKSASVYAVERVSPNDRFQMFFTSSFTGFSESSLTIGFDKQNFSVAPTTPSKPVSPAAPTAPAVVPTTPITPEAETVVPETVTDIDEEIVPDVPATIITTESESNNKVQVYYAIEPTSRERILLDANEVKILNDSGNVDIVGINGIFNVTDEDVQTEDVPPLLTTNNPGSLNNAPTGERLQQHSDMLDYLRTFIPNFQERDLHLLNDMHSQMFFGKTKENGLYGAFVNGVIYAMTGNTNDPVFKQVLKHEVFHKVFRQYLNDDERARVYQQAREEYNLYGMSDIEIEEYLAVNFQKRPDFKRNSLLQRFLSFLRTLYNMIFRNVETIEQFYQKIESGYFGTFRNQVSAEDQFNPENVAYLNTLDVFRDNEHLITTARSIFNSAIQKASMDRSDASVYDGKNEMLVKNAAKSDYELVQTAFEYMKNRMFNTNNGLKTRFFNMMVNDYYTRTTDGSYAQLTDQSLLNALARKEPVYSVLRNIDTVTEDDFTEHLPTDADYPKPLNNSELLEYEALQKLFTQRLYINDQPVDIYRDISAKRKLEIDEMMKKFQDEQLAKLSSLKQENKETTKDFEKRLKRAKAGYERNIAYERRRLENQEKDIYPNFLIFIKSDYPNYYSIISKVTGATDFLNKLKATQQMTDEQKSDLLQDVNMSEDSANGVVDALEDSKPEVSILGDILDKEGSVNPNKTLSTNVKTWLKTLFSRDSNGQLQPIKDKAAMAVLYQKIHLFNTQTYTEFEASIRDNFGVIERKLEINDKEYIIEVLSRNANNRAIRVLKKIGKKYGITVNVENAEALVKAIDKELDILVDSVTTKGELSEMAMDSKDGDLFDLYSRKVIESTNSNSLQVMIDRRIKAARAFKLKGLIDFDKANPEDIIQYDIKEQVEEFKAPLIRSYNHMRQLKSGETLEEFENRKALRKAEIDKMVLDFTNKLNAEPVSLSKVDEIKERFKEQKLSGNYATYQNAKNKNDFKRALTSSGYNRSYGDPVSIALQEKLLALGKESYNTQTEIYNRKDGTTTYLNHPKHYYFIDDNTFNLNGKIIHKGKRDITINGHKVKDIHNERFFATIWMEWKANTPDSELAMHDVQMINDLYKKYKANTVFLDVINTFNNLVPTNLTSVEIVKDYGVVTSVALMIKQENDSNSKLALSIVTKMVDMMTDSKKDATGKEYPVLKADVFDTFYKKHFKGDNYKFDYTTAESFYYDFLALMGLDDFYVQADDPKKLQNINESIALLLKSIKTKYATAVSNDEDNQFDVQWFQNENFNYLKNITRYINSSRSVNNTSVVKDVNGKQRYFRENKSFADGLVSLLFDYKNAGSDLKKNALANIISNRYPQLRDAINGRQNFMTLNPFNTFSYEESKHVYERSSMHSLDGEFLTLDGIQINDYGITLAKENYKDFLTRMINGSFIGALSEKVVKGQKLKATANSYPISDKNKHKMIKTSVYGFKADKTNNVQGINEMLKLMLLQRMMMPKSVDNVKVYSPWYDSNGQFHLDGLQDLIKNDKNPIQPLIDMTGMYSDVKELEAALKKNGINLDSIVNQWSKAILKRSQGLMNDILTMNELSLESDPSRPTLKHGFSFISNLADVYKRLLEYGVSTAEDFAGNPLITVETKIVEGNPEIEVTLNDYNTKASEYNVQPEHIKPLIDLFYMNTYINDFFLNQITQGDSAYFPNAITAVKRLSIVYGNIKSPLISESHAPANMNTLVLQDMEVFVYRGTNPDVDIKKAGLEREYSREDFSKMLKTKSRDEQRRLSNMFQSIKVLDGGGYMTERARDEFNKGFGSGIKMKGSAKPLGYWYTDASNPTSNKYALVIINDEYARKFPKLFELRLRMDFHGIRPSEFAEARELELKRLDNNINLQEKRRLQELYDKADSFHQAVPQSSIKNGNRTVDAKFNYKTGNWDDFGFHNLTDEKYDEKYSDENERSNQLSKYSEAYSSFEWGIQLDPEDDVDGRVSLPTQLLYFTNVNGNNTEAENNIIYALSSLQGLASRDYLEAGINGKKTSLESLHQLVMNTLKGKENHLNTFAALSMGAEMAVLPLYSNTVSSNFDNLFEKNFLNVKFKGTKGVQVSEALTTDHNGKDLEWDPVTQTAQVYMPLSYKEQVLASDLTLYNKWKLEKDPKAKLLIEKQILDKMPVTMLGFRIPTTGLNSAVRIKIKGFTDERHNRVILPTEVVLRMGSDFDIDTLYIMRPELSGGNAKKDAIASALGLSSGQPIGFSFEGKPIDNFEQRIARLRQNPTVSTVRQLPDGTEKSMTFTLTSNDLRNIERSYYKNLFAFSYMNIINNSDNLLDVNKALNFDRATKVQPLEDGSESLYVTLAKSKGDSKSEEFTILYNQARDAKEFANSIYNPDVADMLESKMNSIIEKSYNLTNLKDRAELQILNQTGKNLTGIFASISKTLAYIQTSFEGGTEFEISDTFQFELNGRKYNGKPIFNEEKNRFEFWTIEGDSKIKIRTFDELQWMVNAAVDNAKEQILAKLNINGTTANVTNGALTTGLPIKDLMIILQQPIVEQMLKFGRIDGDIITALNRKLLRSANIDLDTINVSEFIKKRLESRSFMTGVSKVEGNAKNSIDLRDYIGTKIFENADVFKIGNLAEDETLNPTSKLPHNFKFKGMAYSSLSDAIERTKPEDISELYEAYLRSFGKKFITNLNQYAYLKIDARYKVNKQAVEVIEKLKAETESDFLAKNQKLQNNEELLVSQLYALNTIKSLHEIGEATYKLQRVLAIINSNPNGFAQTIGFETAMAEVFDITKDVANTDTKISSVKNIKTIELPAKVEDLKLLSSFPIKGFDITKVKLFKTAYENWYENVYTPSRENLLESNSILGTTVTRLDTLYGVSPKHKADTQLNEEEQNVMMRKAIIKTLLTKSFLKSPNEKGVLETMSMDTIGKVYTRRGVEYFENRALYEELIDLYNQAYGKGRNRDNLFLQNISMEPYNTFIRTGEVKLQRQNTSDDTEVRQMKTAFLYIDQDLRVEFMRRNPSYEGYWLSPLQKALIQYAVIYEGLSYGSSKLSLYLPDEVTYQFAKQLKDMFSDLTRETTTTNPDGSETKTSGFRELEQFLALSFAVSEPGWVKDMQFKKMVGVEDQAIFTHNLQIEADAAKVDDTNKVVDPNAENKMLDKKKLKANSLKYNHELDIFYHLEAKLRPGLTAESQPMFLKNEFNNDANVFIRMSKTRVEKGPDGKDKAVYVYYVMLPKPTSVMPKLPSSMLNTGFSLDGLISGQFTSFNERRSLISEGSEDVIYTSSSMPLNKTIYGFDNNARGYLQWLQPYEVVSVSSAEPGKDEEVIELYKKLKRPGITASEKESLEKSLRRMQKRYVLKKIGEPITIQDLRTVDPNAPTIPNTLNARLINTNEGVNDELVQGVLKFDRINNNGSIDLSFYTDEEIRLITELQNNGRLSCRLM
jgi:hypothetical protein